MIIYVVVVDCLKILFHRLNLKLQILSYCPKKPHASVHLICAILAVPWLV